MSQYDDFRSVLLNWGLSKTNWKIFRVNGSVTVAASLSPQKNNFIANHHTGRSHKLTSFEVNNANSKCKRFNKCYSLHLCHAQDECDCLSWAPRRDWLDGGINSLENHWNTPLLTIICTYDTNRFSCCKSTKPAIVENKEAPAAPVAEEIKEEVKTEISDNEAADIVEEEAAH